MILPDLSIHLIRKHVPRQLQLLTDDKIKLFHRLKLHDAEPEEIIGSLIGYDTIETDVNCGGYCDYLKSEIALNDRSLKTIFHEIAHGLQAEIGILEVGDYSVISRNLKDEWQAETIAYLLMKNTVSKNVDHRMFKSYFDEEHINFLTEWYEGFAEDDFTDNENINLIKY